MSIRTLNTEAFQVWTSDRGIGRSPKDGEADRLVFKAGGDAGHWAYPGGAARVPEFVSTLLSALRRNERYWVYPDRGVWSPGRDIESEPQARVWMATVRALGLPAGLRGAVGFNSTDWNELLSMLFLQVTLGPDARIDATVIPENGSAVLRFEQNRSVWGGFKEAASFRAVVEAMERAGYSSQAG